MTRKNKQKQNQNNKNKNNARPSGNRRSRKSRNQQQVQAYQNPSLGSIGGQLGTVAGNFLSKIFGLGAYKINKNSVFDSITNDQVPFMHSSSETVVLRHREFITDVSTSINFAIQTYDLNPGLDATFPFLSAIAQNFQEYEFRGIVFEYKSTSATALNSTNTALGTMMMAAQYQADADDFVNKQQLLNEMWSVDAKPSDSFILPIECDPKENPFKVQYVRTGAVPSGADQKLYDLCKFTIASVGSQAASVAGELWCTYEVVLRKPRLSSGLDLAGESTYYQLTSPTGTNLLGTPYAIFNRIGTTISSNKLTFPEGSQGLYSINYYMHGSTDVSVAYSTPTFVNCVAKTLPGSWDVTILANNGVSNYAHHTMVIYIANPELTSSIDYVPCTFPGGTTTGVLMINQVNGNLL